MARQLRIEKTLWRLTVACALLGASLVESRAQSYYWTTIAGPGYGSMDGTNQDAQFGCPFGLAIDGAGSLYLADVCNHNIRKITPVGTNWVVTTVAGGSQGTSDGTNTSAQFYEPEFLAAESATSLYVPDGSAIRRIVLIGTNWVVSTVAGNPGTTGTADGTNGDALFVDADGATFAAGDLYETEGGAWTVRKVSRAGTNWVVTTLAGSPHVGGSADGTNGAAQFFGPEGLAADAAGNLYVADSGNRTIRKVAPSGTNWVVTTLAGSAQVGGSADGTNGTARFLDPVGIAADASGNLYVTDEENRTVRKLTPSGTNWVVTTVGGLASQYGSVDGLGSDARFERPVGIAVDNTGNLYVADGHRIRKGTPIPPAPLLSISLLPGQVVLSWPGTATNFVLEASAELPPDDSWTPLTNGVAAIGGQFVLTNSVSAGAAFYRLHNPGG